ncbi:MAG: fumarylacetoacetate hydrolase family protein [Oscillospiraceae bacterium]|nr:fumarylacetoacetate hydrolase family protein [Oscillospiraceae bacterium]
MKFLTFSQNDGAKEEVGVLSPDGERVHGLSRFSDMYELIEAYPREREEILRLSHEPGGLPLGQVKIHAPITRPRHDIICVGMNYLQHAIESARFKGVEYKKLSQPVYFGKRVNRAVGHGEAIPPHCDFTEKLDYESELGVVMGRRCDHAGKEEVFDYIFGYTIINDVSARDLQNNHGGQFFLGKGLDGFTPIGPWIVTADEFACPPNFKVKCRVNGEERQNSNTGEFIFDIPFLVSQLSRGIVLEPGDMIATGTPSGVGMGFQPPKFLSPGDVIECEIEGIGVLRNYIGQS